MKLWKRVKVKFKKREFLLDGAKWLREQLSFSTGLRTMDL
jgi:hypothetical protein